MPVALGNAGGGRRPSWKVLFLPGWLCLMPTIKKIRAPPVAACPAGGFAPCTPREKQSAGAKQRTEQNRARASTAGGDDPKTEVLSRSVETRSSRGDWRISRGTECWPTTRPAPRDGLRPPDHPSPCLHNHCNRPAIWCYTTPIRCRSCRQRQHSAWPDGKMPNADVLKMPVAPILQWVAANSPTHG